MFAKMYLYDIMKIKRGIKMGKKFLIEQIIEILITLDVESLRKVLGCVVGCRELLNKKKAENK